MWVNNESRLIICLKCIIFCDSKIIKNRTLCTILTITTVSPTKHNVLHHNVGMSQSLLCMTELHNFDFIIDIFAEQQLTFVISVISVFLLDCKTHSGVSCSRTFNIVTGQAHIDGKMMRVCFLIGLKKKELYYYGTTHNALQWAI